MVKHKKIAFLFPGQGAQYVGMGKDFFQQFPLVKQTFEEADDLLGRKLSKIVFEGPEEVLTETRNSQAAIFVLSVALLRLLQNLFPELKPQFCAGLSLGEYTALHASGRLPFSDTLHLVQKRGQYMNDACERTPGTMAVVLGLDAETAENLVKEVNQPKDLWVANFNCPGQVVLSGTLKGIEAGAQAAKAKGAKRVLPLQVHGAFHSGLMQQAEVNLAAHILPLQLAQSQVDFVMNVTGTAVSDANQIKQNLIKQVTHSVRWEQGVRYIASQHADLYLEIGCGKTLSGFNKRIGIEAPTFSLEKVEELKTLEENL